MKGCRSDAPWFVVIDTETTSNYAFGDILELGAIRVDSKTLQVVGEYYGAVKPSDGAEFNDPGKKHFNKVKDVCSVAPSINFALEEYLSFLRGPVKYSAPVLAGFCIKKHDIPTIAKFIPDVEHWFLRAEAIDVAVDLAFNMFPEDGEVKRSLSNIATSLGIGVDSSAVHNPVYDCKLCLQVWEALEQRKQSKGIELVKPSTPTIINPTAPGAFEWAKARFDDPKYRTIRCPMCNEPSMKLCLHRVIKPEDGADNFHYWCTKCNYRMNCDGTKGIKTNRVFKADVETLVLKN